MPSLAAMPVQRRPLVAPHLPPSPQMQPLNAPTIGAAPTSTPTAAFQAPALPGGMDPYQWRVDQANKGAQRSAAARGTLLSGGFQTALAKLNQGLASQEVDNIYGRARDTYTLNRDTNQQNYGQSLAGYGATLDAGRFNLAGQTAVYDRNYAAGRDAYGDARDAAMQQTDVVNANAGAESDFTQQMAAYRAWLDEQRAADVARQNAATTAQRGKPLGPSLGWTRQPVLR